MRSQKLSRRSAKGFTLLELMMVVVIIAILASIALPNFIRASERARVSEALQVMSALRGAALRFQAQSPTQALPTTMAQLDTNAPASTNWAYTISANDFRAQRTGGANNGSRIFLDMVNGNNCYLSTDTTNPFAMAAPTVGGDCI